MLTESDLAFVRSSQVLAMPDTCTLRRAVTTGDGGGGSTSSWSAVATHVCRLHRLTASERTSGGRLAQDAAFVLTVEAATDVRAGDRVRMADAREMEVSGMAPGSWETARRVYLREVA